MIENRRQFLQKAGTGIAALSLAKNSSSMPPSGTGLRIGMCDWNLGPRCDPGQIPTAKEAHLDGIQVSVGTVPMRCRFVRRPSASSISASVNSMGLPFVLSRRD